MGLQMFLSLVARAATLGNSCNLHKCKMTAMDSGFASGWDTIQLIYLISCVTPLYHILFPGELIFGVNLVIRGQSIGQMSSSRPFSFKECSTYMPCTYVLGLENKFSTTKTSQHEPLTVLCTVVNLCSLDGDTSTVQQAPLRLGQLGRITC